MRREYDAAQAWRKQTGLGLKWAKVAACCVRNKREGVVEVDRAALRQSQLMFFHDKLDAIAGHASRIALTAHGATPGRVVGKRTTGHVGSGRS